MSGFTEQEASARFVGRGLAGFLQKAFTALELLAIVSQARKRDDLG